jgi:hypothetical protein
MGKRPGSSEEVCRYESMWALIHMCMATTLGISLYSYFCFKLAKLLYCSYYLLCFLFNKIREQDGRTGWGGSPNNVNTCK